MTDLEKAKALLHSAGYTAVLCHGERAIYFTARGIKPLVSLYQSGEDVRVFSAADKVVGKGAAFMYLLLGMRRVYAAVISRPALALLLNNGVTVDYDTLAENIRNRQGDGLCPFEAAVLEVSDKTQAYAIIQRTMKQLGID